MTTLGWIVLAGVAMLPVNLAGGVTLLLREETRARLLLPLVAFAAGALLGGAFFHMLPGALERMGTAPVVFLWLLAGFAVFFLLEQFLHWHHCHRAEGECREPVTWLILIGEGLHHLLGGLAVAGAFLLDVRVGIAAWAAAALHEVPQALGNFAVLLHSGWRRSAAVGFMALAALTFLLGGLIAYGAAREVDVTFLLPAAAGMFVYIAASDLVPQVNRHPGAITAATHFAAFAVGALLLFVAAR